MQDKLPRAREAYLIFALHSENRSRHVLGDQATRSPKPPADFNPLFEAPLPCPSTHETCATIHHTKPSYRQRTIHRRKRAHSSHSGSCYRQTYLSGLIIPTDCPTAIHTMPTSILKTAQPTPDQMEAGSSEPLIQRTEVTNDHQQANANHRRRFWVSLAIALGVAAFLILVLGLGGKQLTRKRFRWPGGPA